MKLTAKQKEPLRKITCCTDPLCQSADGYFVKKVVVYEQHFDFDDRATYATEPEVIRGGSIAYCLECGRRLGRIVDGKLVKGDT